MANAHSSYSMLTSRLAWVFLALAVSIAICAGAATFLATTPKLQSMMWGASLVIVALSGLMSIRFVRPLRTIESELLRLGQSQEGAKQWAATIRPIIGSDGATEQWNRMLDEFNQTSEPSIGQRANASLDQEVITMARAMRGLPVAWVITDVDGRIRFIGPAACGLFGLDQQDDVTNADILQLLGFPSPDGASHKGPDVLSADDAQPTTESEDASEAQAKKDENDRTQLLSRVRMVQVKRELKIGSRSVHVRVMRARMDGRSGDAEGFAWVLSDNTQQQVLIRARDEFLMTATHELRTPLSNLQAYAETLASSDQLEVEDQKEFCNIINSEAIRLGRLVDELLTVSQMEAGSLVVHQYELELLPILESVVEQSRVQAEKQQIDLSTSYATKLPTIKADRDKLQAVLMNLIGNAIKYTQAGGEVNVRCAESGQEVLISIEDNGPGIAKEEQDRVFEKFYRCENASQTESRGNGLGLAFSRDIARLHGGDVVLRSEVGEGSVFELRLPVGGRVRSGL